MNQTHPFRLTIPPVPDGLQRPIWSVMIPTYNCAEYLRETLGSVLRQAPDPEKMQIEVIDDCSTQDDPEAVVQELGQGRVTFYRQPQNVGYIRNFETCLLRSRGHLLHILHGDDCVRDGFYQKLQLLFEQHPEIGAAYCRHLFMDQAGHWMRLSVLEQPKSGILGDGLERILVRHPIQTPAIAVRRSIYEQLGGFDRRFTCNGEDWEMWVRIATEYPIGYEVEPLALYRCRTNSLSGNAIREARDMRDIQQALTIIPEYLPSSIPQGLWQKAREFWAYCGLHHALEMITQGDFQGAGNQLRESFKLCPSLKVLAVYGAYLSLTLMRSLTKEKDARQMFLQLSSEISTH